MLRLAAILVAVLVTVFAAPAAAGVICADLAVTVTESPDPVAPGSTITYTVTVVSNGMGSSNVQMSNPLPAGTTFQSLSAPGGWTCPSVPAVGAGGTVTCTAATLAAGAPATFTIVVRVDPSVTDGTTLSNTASVTSASCEANAADNSDTETTTVSVPSADLAVALTDSPEPVAPGAQITYAAGVTNSGPDDAHAVTFSDALPASTTFVSLTVPAGWTCSVPAPGATGTVSCSRATLAAGVPSQDFTLVVAVSASATPGGTISNTATVAATTVDPASANDTATATTTVAGDDGGSQDVDDTPPSTTPVTSAPAVTPTPPAPPAGRRLICRRVPTLRRHSISGARFILARDGCAVKLRWVGRYRRGGRRANRITSQSVRPGTPLYEGATLVVRINGRPARQAR